MECCIWWDMIRNVIWNSTIQYDTIQREIWYDIGCDAMIWSSPWLNSLTEAHISNNDMSMQYTAVNNWVSNIKYLHLESNAFFSRRCWCYLPGIVVSGCIYTVINTNGAVTLTAKVALESAGYSMHVSEVCLGLIVYLVPDLKLLTESLSGDVDVFTVSVVSQWHQWYRPSTCQKYVSLGAFTQCWI